MQGVGGRNNINPISTVIESGGSKEKKQTEELVAAKCRNSSD